MDIATLLHWRSVERSVTSVTNHEKLFRLNQVPESCATRFVPKLSKALSAIALYTEKDESFALLPSGRCDTTLNSPAGAESTENWKVDVLSPGTITLKFHLNDTPVYQSRS